MSKAVADLPIKHIIRYAKLVLGAKAGIGVGAYRFGRMALERDRKFKPRWMTDKEWLARNLDFMMERLAQKTIHITEYKRDRDNFYIKLENI